MAHEIASTLPCSAITALPCRRRTRRGRQDVQLPSASRQIPRTLTRTNPSTKLPPALPLRRRLSFSSRQRVSPMVRGGVLPSPFLKQPRAAVNRKAACCAMCHGRSAFFRGHVATSSQRRSPGSVGKYSSLTHLHPTWACRFRLSYPRYERLLSSFHISFSHSHSSSSSSAVGGQEELAFAGRTSHRVRGPIRSTAEGSNRSKRYVQQQLKDCQTAMFRSEEEEVGAEPHVPSSWRVRCRAQAGRHFENRDGASHTRKAGHPEIEGEALARHK